MTLDNCRTGHLGMVHVKRRPATQDLPALFFPPSGQGAGPRGDWEGAMQAAGWVVDPDDTCQHTYWDRQPGMSHLPARARTAQGRD
jgi:hypothetical protein